MPTPFLQHIPQEFVNFILVTVFSLLIGLEQRRHNIILDPEKLFGTDRTFTLIGILGYILFIISPKDIMLFAGGGAVITFLLGVYYFQKIKIENKFGFTSLITALITYCLAPLVYTQPIGLVLLIVVFVLVITEIKEGLLAFSKKMDNKEFITLAKFLVLAGVILPLLPDSPMSAEINVSPYKLWLSVVVVSGISYLSYLLKKFVFPDAGILLTGVLGGLYSSTATTVILARKSKEDPAEKGYIPAMILATTMMYLRIFLLALFFNREIAMGLLPYFIIFIILSVAMTFLFWKFSKSPVAAENEQIIVKEQSNPLEFKTALFFSGLFIFFAVATTYVLTHFGTSGINGMAFIVGVTDIDPFILNLFQHNANITHSIIITAVINAITSNNVLKLIYSLVLADKSLRKGLAMGFSVLIAAGIICFFFLPDKLFIPPT